MGEVDNRAGKPVHTPGPWTLECVPYFYNIRKDGLVSGIATIQAVSPSSSEALANAKLIIAACNAFDSSAKKLGVNAVELAERMAEGGIAALVSALAQAREHIDGEIDVVEGSYGEPAPNAAMTLAQEIDEALAKVRGAS